MYETCIELLATGGPAVRTRFGYSDSDAFAVGLTCGGEIDILMHRMDSWALAQLTAAIADWDHHVPAALVQIADGPNELLGRTLHVRADGSHSGTLRDPNADRAVLAHTVAMLRAGRAGPMHIGGPGDDCAPLAALVHHRPTRPRMLIFGAVDFAAALSEVGRFLGYHVTVCDARATFATRARFPHADDVIVDWPHRYLAGADVDSRTVVCVLTHDAKFDVPLLETALRLPVGYVGAMGSRRTHEHRLELLRAAGVSPNQLARLHSPIGMDLGAATPEQTAISIAAEIIAVANCGSGRPLSRISGPIHKTSRQDISRTESAVA